VRVGQPIALIAEADEALPDLESLRAAPKPAEGAAVKASFGARRLAKELGVDLAALAPARADGRITEEDVRRCRGADPRPSRPRAAAPQPLKRAVATHLAASPTRSCPHWSASRSTSMPSSARCRRSARRQACPWRRANGVDLPSGSPPALHPLLNACFDGDAIVVYER